MAIYHVPGHDIMTAVQSLYLCISPSGATHKSELSFFLAVSLAACEAVAKRGD